MHSALETGGQYVQEHTVYKTAMDRALQMCPPHHGRHLEHMGPVAIIGPANLRHRTRARQVNSSTYPSLLLID
jgi:hypothetical protein